jgi:hypothetical protein
MDTSLEFLAFTRLLQHPQQLPPGEVRCETFFTGSSGLRRTSR